MAILTDAQRQATRDKLMRDIDAGWVDLAATKPELRLLIDDLDNYLDANAAAINLAISASIRSKFTAAQKARALAYVALKRYSG